MHTVLCHISLIGLILAVPTASAETCVNGVCLVDRAASGEIVLGNIRGVVSAIDYDNDGHPDLAIADVGGAPYRLFHNVPDPVRPGNRTFADVTVGSGLNDSDGVSRGFGGVVVADYDNDGDSDLYFAGYLSTGGQSDGALYRNDGNGTFANVSLTAGIRSAGNHPESVSWTDYDLDGYVDLFIANQVTSAVPARLLRNNHDGTFTNASNLLPSLPIPGHCYSHAWMDYDHDGYADCVMLQNSNPPALLRNVSNGNGGRMFVNVAGAAGFTHLGPAPMGIAAGDHDNDGDLDLCITDGSVGTHYRNNGDGTMTEITPFQTFFGWGTSWIDVDNDGDLDNYQAGSWGNANVDRLTMNLGRGQWSNISAALNTTALASQFAIQIDFNSDGKQDLITVNPGTPGQFISVYENGSTLGGHWLKLRLVGDGAQVNRSAIGAVARVFTATGMQMREVISGSSTTATEDLRLHFGVGPATSVQRVEILWPRQGTLSSRTDVFEGPIVVDQILTLQPIPRGPGDVTLDGVVGIDDLLAVIAGWGPCPAAPALCPADIAPTGGDGSVDISDLLDVITNWN
jgi:enediyne biosynthesis protein E4